MKTGALLMRGQTRSISLLGENLWMNYPARKNETPDEETPRDDYAFAASPSAVSAVS